MPVRMIIISLHVFVCAIVFQDDTPTSLGLVSWTVIWIHMTRPVVVASSSANDVDDKERPIKDLSAGMCAWFELFFCIIPYRLENQHICRGIQESTEEVTNDFIKKISNRPNGFYGCPFLADV